MNLAIILALIWLAWFAAWVLAGRVARPAPIEEVHGRTFVIPHLYHWAAHHGYRSSPTVRVGARALRGIRFQEGDELVIIGPLSGEDYELIDIARRKSDVQPKVVLL